MSAESYGARLLEEVQEETLEKLLNQIRHTVNPPPSSILGITPLDKLLEACRLPEGQNVHIPSNPQGWTQSSEITSTEDNEVQNTARSLHSQRPNIARNLITGATRPASIELTSSKSSTGKTNLLYYITAKSILPQDFDGKETTVVWLDTDGRFSAIRLAKILSHEISNHQNESTLDLIQEDEDAEKSMPTVDVNKICNEALNHVHIFRPQSSTHLLNTLINLSTYLLSRNQSQPQHKSIHRILSLIIIDSATTFYWQDRFDFENEKIQKSSKQNWKKSKTTEIINILKSLQEKYDCTVVFTTNHQSYGRGKVISSSSLRDDQDLDLEADPFSKSTNPWTLFATLTLRLSRLEVPKFAPGMNLDECKRDQNKRMEALKQGIFFANVLNSGKRGGPNRGLEGFRFRIYDEGVEI